MLEYIPLELDLCCCVQKPGTVGTDTRCCHQNRKWRGKPTVE